MKKEIIKEKMNEFHNKGLMFSQVRKILNIKESEIVKYIFDDIMDITMPSYNVKELDFYENELGFHFNCKTNKIDFEVVQINSCKEGMFHFDKFIFESKSVRNQMSYNFRSYKSYIAKIDSYRTLKDVKRTFFDEEELSTKFEIDGKKKISKIKKGDILQLKIYRKESNNYSNLKHRFFYVISIDKKTIRGVFANTYKRATTVARLIN